MRYDPAKAFAFLVASFVAMSGSTADGGFLEDVGRVVTAPIVAPVEGTINIIRGDDPMSAVTGPLESAGRVIQQSSDAFQSAHDTFMAIPRDAIGSSLGNDWVQAYDFLTGSQRVQFELAMTSGRFLGKCLQGQPCGVAELAAAPLAAAMRDAYKVYIGHSVQLDPRLVQILSRVVPPHVLNATKWTVGATPDFTVPGFLNAGYEAFGQGHAVTLGNVIIFSRPLNLQNRGDWNWLLHEIRHVEQYMSYSRNVMESIDGFAVDYVQNYSRIESDAQRTADERQRTLDQVCQFGC